MQAQQSSLTTVTGKWKGQPFCPPVAQGHILIETLPSLKGAFKVTPGRGLSSFQPTDKGQGHIVLLLPSQWLKHGLMAIPTCK